MFGAIAKSSLEWKLSMRHYKHKKETIIDYTAHVSPNPYHYISFGYAWPELGTYHDFDTAVHALYEYFNIDPNDCNATEDIDCDAGYLILLVPDKDTNKLFELGAIYWEPKNTEDTAQ